MAKQQQTISYRQILADLKEKKYKPVYFLSGEEPYFIDLVANYIADNVLTKSEQDFNQTICYGKETSMRSVIESARAYPMMAEHQVIIVKEAQNIKNVDELEKYLDHPSPQTVLVYCYKNGNIDKRKKIISKAKSVGVVFESVKLKDAALPTFISSYMKAHGVTIDQKIISVIAESIGSNLTRLSSELDKLILSLPDNDKRVTPELVEKVVGVSKDYNPFELRNALLSRNISKAYGIINYFDKNPKSGGAFVLVPSLFSFFQNLMLVWYAPNRNNAAAVAQYMGFKTEWQVRDYISGMRVFSAMKTMQIISKLCEIDEKNKGLNSSNTPSGDLMKELIFFILH